MSVRNEIIKYYFNNDFTTDILATTEPSESFVFIARIDPKESAQF